MHFCVSKTKREESSGVSEALHGYETSCALRINKELWVNYKGFSGYKHQEHGHTNRHATFQQEMLIVL